MNSLSCATIGAPLLVNVCLCHGTVQVNPSCVVSKSNQDLDWKPTSVNYKVPCTKMVYRIPPQPVRLMFNVSTFQDTGTKNTPDYSARRETHETKKRLVLLGRQICRSRD